MQPTDVAHPLGLLDHAAWLHTRLLRRSDDLGSVFDDGNADPKAVDGAIDALAILLKDWPRCSRSSRPWPTNAMCRISR
jgi:hypothetical protein